MVVAFLGTIVFGGLAGPTAGALSCDIAGGFTVSYAWTQDGDDDCARIGVRGMYIWYSDYSVGWTGWRYTTGTFVTASGGDQMIDSDHCIC